MTATKKFAHLVCLNREALEYISDLVISEENLYTSHEKFEDAIQRQTKKNIGFIYHVTEFGKLKELGENLETNQLWTTIIGKLRLCLREETNDGLYIAIESQGKQDPPPKGKENCFAFATPKIEDDSGTKIFIMCKEAMLVNPYEREKCEKVGGTSNLSSAPCDDKSRENYNETTTTKLVFDPQQKLQKVRVKRMLIKVSVMLSLPVGIIIRARQTHYVIMADVEKAFLQLEDIRKETTTEGIAIYDSKEHRLESYLFHFCSLQSYGICSITKLRSSAESVEERIKKVDETGWNITKESLQSKRQCTNWDDKLETQDRYQCEKLTEAFIDVPEIITSRWVPKEKQELRHGQLAWRDYDQAKKLVVRIAQSEVFLEVIEKLGLVIQGRLFGPTWVNNGTMLKSWMALITYIFTGAIHIEIIKNMSGLLRLLYKRTGDILSKDYVQGFLWPGYKDVKNSSKYENNLRVNDEPNASMLCTTKANLWRIDIIERRKPKKFMKHGLSKKADRGKNWTLSTCCCEDVEWHAVYSRCRTPVSVRDLRSLEKESGSSNHYTDVFRRLDELRPSFQARKKKSVGTEKKKSPTSNSARSGRHA
ncbi:hypothetical protein DINM_004901 [Dirofilaria immitis]|nr:hypothetical protein [Dirofilaria immitis]